MTDDKEPPRPSDLDFWLCNHEVGKVQFSDGPDESGECVTWITMWPTDRAGGKMRGPKLKVLFSDVEPLIECGWSCGLALVPTDEVIDRTYGWWGYHEAIEREEFQRRRAEKLANWPHAIPFFVPSNARGGDHD